MEYDASADQLRIMGASADAVTSTGKLLLATSLTNINANDVIGKIDFQAPHEAGGTDAITVAASIQAMAQATFSGSVNATDLIFFTGHSEAATEKFRFTSQGELGVGGANYGTDGQVLTSAGAGAAAAWEAAGGGGGYIQMQVFTSSGTYTPHANTRIVKVTVTGGGGGGGGQNTPTNERSSGGGGSAGTAIMDISIDDLGSTETVTIGAAGAGGASGENDGGTGGTSSFGSHCTATGGTGGGWGKPGTAGYGGNAGLATGTGAIQLRGMPPFDSCRPWDDAVAAGHRMHSCWIGAASYWGTQYYGGTDASKDNCPGAGGPAFPENAGSGYAAAGYAGSAGICVIEEFE
jgi:hypothetical protein